MKYKFGDIVKAYDRDEKGVVSYIYQEDTRYPYQIDFEDGESEDYSEEELQPWEEKLSYKTSNPVEHPDHYTCHDMECIDEMLLLFGEKAVTDFAALNAWKYRYRAGSKENASAEQDNKKADEYIQILKRIKEED